MWSTLLSYHITGKELQEICNIKHNLSSSCAQIRCVELLQTFDDVTCGPRISTELVLYNSLMPNDL
jgi:hypothetical protein